MLGDESENPKKEQAEQFTVFIGWGGAGKQTADNLSKELEQRGVRTLMAPRDVDWGEESEPVMREMIETSDAYVLVCTKDACCSPWVMKEIGWAGSRVLPLKVDSEPLHPMVLKLQNHPFNSQSPDYDSCNAALRKSIRRFRDKVSQTTTTIVPPTSTIQPVGESR